uniref:Deoxyguanosinetriphosphate triphosphohydrolase n=1 Tax=Ignavibacterium album TaxID=591197 RepID=A0A832G8I6_9BACT
MEWKKLLSSVQLGTENKNYISTHDGRSQFQRDFDRIVFSPAFRRLQDKTQVFPLPESDFVHTRLTHSLEVSVVGRSLGNLVGEKIISRHSELKNDFTKFHFGEIVAAACLAHDIGNPPFGHSGEESISEYFKNGNGKKFEDIISDKKKWNDLIKFEGNAQGFRIITKLQNPKVNGGLRLTYSTLAALTKYPKESLTDFDSKDNSQNKIYKKFGFFQSEKEIFKSVAEHTGLDKLSTTDYFWCRHPLSFLVEAADDICYRIMDLEDGYRLGLVTFNETEQLLKNLIRIELVSDYNQRDDAEKIGYLRAKAISELVKELAEVFLDNESNILSAKLNDELISLIPAAKGLLEIEKLSVEKIYRHRTVVEREAAGYEVIGGLLDAFINSFNEWLDGNIKPKNRTLVNLLPKRILQSASSDTENYERLLMIIDFISGMTDSFAVSLFRKIKGISLPGSRLTE